MKTQTIRIFDVLLIGPLMVWAGEELAHDKPIRGHGLALLGVATIFYNARNYLKVDAE